MLAQVTANADKPARRKILQQSRDNNYAPFVGDMSSCC